MFKILLISAGIGLLITIIYVFVACGFTFCDFIDNFLSIFEMYYIFTIIIAFIISIFISMTKKYELTDENYINLSKISFYVKNEKCITIDKDCYIDEVFLTDDKSSYLKISNYISNYNENKTNTFLYIGENFAETKLSSFLKNYDYYYNQTPQKSE